MASNESPANNEQDGKKAVSRGYILKSSFPKLKSSGLRGIPFPSVFDWLKGAKYFKNMVIQRKQNKKPYETLSLYVLQSSAMMIIWDLIGEFMTNCTT